MTDQDQTRWQKNSQKNRKLLKAQVVPALTMIHKQNAFQLLLDSLCTFLILRVVAILRSCLELQS